MRTMYGAINDLSNRTFNHDNSEVDMFYLNLFKMQKVADGRGLKITIGEEVSRINYVDP